MKAKKIWSILLTLAMAASLLSGLSVFASAEDVYPIAITGNATYSDRTFDLSGKIVEHVFKITGSGMVKFENVTFMNVTGSDDGSCVYVDAGKVKVVFENCRFINCSASGSGGAVAVQDISDGQEVVFSNCYAVNCRAGEDGGFMYVNDAGASVYGSGNTVISGCSAGNSGGGIYMDLGEKVDGFILADNNAETRDGGGICNTSNGAEISNCRFYRNTSKGNGGGIYTDEATVESCKFFENKANGTDCELFTNDDDTLLKGCAITNNDGWSAIVGAKMKNCELHRVDYFTLSTGDGTLNNPYLIENIDDWDALHYMVLRHYRSEYSDGYTEESVAGDPFKGKHIRLDNDITVCNPIGESYTDTSSGYISKSEFTGIFNGNDHTVNYINYNESTGEKAAFAYANGATVKNLTVDGYIKGNRTLGGIFGNAWCCTAENCVNNATVCGTEAYVGGIVGYAGSGTRVINCINRGEIKGGRCIGGIIGFEGGAVSVENCIAEGEVSATALAGAYPAEGDYRIYSSSGLCFGTQGGEGATLRLWTASGDAAKVFTLTYDAQYDAYIITEKQSGLLLTADLGNVLSQDWVSVFLNQMRSDYPTLQRWIFVPDAYGNCRIRSLAYNGWSMNVANGTENEGAYIIAYKYGGNDLFRLAPEPNQVMNSVLADGITGYHNSGSNYEQCFYNTAVCSSDYGIGLSDNAMKGVSADTVGDESYIMPDAINNYIKANYKEDDSWAFAYLNEENRLVFNRARPKCYYFDAKGKAVEVENPTEITSAAKELTGGIYIVKGNVTVNRRLYIPSDGQNVVIILEDDSTLNVTGGIGINVKKSSLTIASQSFGKHMGKLIARGSTNIAGIGTDKNGDADSSSINIYGGNITATAGDFAAGIGTGLLSGTGAKNDLGSITITGGIVTATGGKSAAGIGTGDAMTGYNECHNIIITGGSITATGGENGAGIGTGSAAVRGTKTGSVAVSHNKCENITISGGSIVANAANTGSVERIGYGRYGEATVNYAGVTHERKGNAEWVNLAYVPGASFCETAGYKEAYREAHTDPEKNRYYIAFPFIEDNLIGYGDEYNNWKNEGDGYVAPLGHSNFRWKVTKAPTCVEEGTEAYICGRCGSVSETRILPVVDVHESYIYSGSYDEATQIYTLKKVCSKCRKEAGEEALTYSVPIKSYRKYLEVTDKAYIDTGYKPTSNTRAVMDVEVNSNKEYWFGAWDEDYNKGVFALGNDVGNVFVGFGNDGGGKGSSAVSNGGHMVELNKNTAYIDGNVFATLKTSDAFTLGNPLYLFAQNRKGTAYVPNNQKITCRSFMISEGNNLVHYYIPYVKDGESGLYDLIDGEFFGNANTEGTMTAVIEDVVAILRKDETCVENGHKAHYYSVADDAYFEDPDCTVMIDDVDAWKNNGAGLLPAMGKHIDGNGDECCDVCGYYFWDSDDTYYLNKTLADDNTVITEKTELERVPSITEDDAVWGADNTEKWYVLLNDISLKNRPTVKGTVHLILVNKQVLTAPAGISVDEGANLIIHAQTDDAAYMGELYVPQGGVAENYPAIGGAGSVTIHGGNISLYGGFDGAGIGCGWKGSCDTITVYGGIVKANGGTNASGIGSGMSGNYSKINIHGGKVNATGGNFCAGIGGCNGGETHDITITGGEITATGGLDAYAIKGINGKITETIDIAPYMAVRIGGSDGELVTDSAEYVNTAANNKTVTFTEPKISLILEGKGTKDEPYIIDSAEKLNTLQSYVNSGMGYTGTYFKLTADIETPLTQPIGSTAAPFRGIFDGDGHTVSLNIQGDSNVGLFGACENATVKNVITAGSVSASGNAAGGIVGKALGDTTVLNCINTADITAFKYIGGIIGDTAEDESKTVLIENCMNYADITALEGGENAGGIAGHMAYCGTLISCFTSGAVSDAGNSGIVVGWANRKFTCDNCYYEALDGNEALPAIRTDNSFLEVKDPTATGVKTKTDAGMIAEMNGYIAENSDNTADWYYWTVKGDKAWLANDMSEAENFLLLTVTGNAFTADALGKDAGVGTVAVALYDGEDQNRLLDMKTFDLVKNETPTGEFTQSGYVKAFWWSGFEKMKPLCAPVGKETVE